VERKEIRTKTLSSLRKTGGLKLKRGKKSSHGKGKKRKTNNRCFVPRKGGKRLLRKEKDSSLVIWSSENKLKLASVRKKKGKGVPKKKKSATVSLSKRGERAPQETLSLSTGMGGQKKKSVNRPKDSLELRKKEGAALARRKIPLCSPEKETRNLIGTTATKKKRKRERLYGRGGGPQVVRIAGVDSERVKKRSFAKEDFGKRRKGSTIIEKKGGGGGGGGRSSLQVSMRTEGEKKREGLKKEGKRTMSTLGKKRGERY